MPISCAHFNYKKKNKFRRDREAAMKSLCWFQGEKKENAAILDEYLHEIEETPKKRSSIREVFTTWHLRFAVYISLCVLVLTVALARSRLQSKILRF